jgi:hypothetical protein
MQRVTGAADRSPPFDLTEVYAEEVDVRGRGPISLVEFLEIIGA